MSGAGEKQCSWRRVPRHRTEGGGGWGGSAGFAAEGASERAERAERAERHRKHGRLRRHQSMAGCVGTRAWPAAPASGTWPASPADQLGMRQSLPVHALIAGNDCRLVGVKRGY